MLGAELLNNEYILRIAFLFFAVLSYYILTHTFNAFLCDLKQIHWLDIREIGVFNTREIAIFICIILPFLLLYKKHLAIRRSSWQLLNAFLVRDIIIISILAIMHLLVIAFLLKHFHLWRPSFIKDATIWLMFSGMVTIFNVYEAAEKKNYFADIIIDNIKLSALIQFISGLKTFNIIVEILVVVLSFLIGGMLAVIDDKKDKSLKGIFNGIAICLGLWMLYHSISTLASGWRDVDSKEQILSFLLPLIFSLWYLPFFYFQYLYMIYERKFKSMKSSIKDSKVLLYAQLASLITFRTDTESLERWIKLSYTDKLETKDDVSKSIKNLRLLQSVERSYRSVRFEDGWSPYLAKDFLMAEGVSTGYYDKCFDDCWQASSEYIKLNQSQVEEDGIYYIGDNFSYYVSGDSLVAKQLKLILNVNSLRYRKLSVERFVGFSKVLYHKAFSEEMPLILLNSLNREKQISINSGNRIISIRRENFNNQMKGFCLVFTVKVDDYVA